MDSYSNPFLWNHYSVLETVFTQTLYLCACACDNEEEEGAHSKKEEMKHRKTMKKKTNIMRKRMKKN